MKVRVTGDGELNLRRIHFCREREYGLKSGRVLGTVELCRRDGSGRVPPGRRSRLRRTVDDGKKDEIICGDHLGLVRP